MNGSLGTVLVCLAEAAGFDNPPVYVPELHDKYEGTLVEKELQRNYDCLREAKKRGVVMTIGSDSFSFVTPYGTSWHR